MTKTVIQSFSKNKSFHEKSEVRQTVLKSKINTNSFTLLLFQQKAHSRHWLVLKIHASFLPQSSDVWNRRLVTPTYQLKFERPNSEKLRWYFNFVDDSDDEEANNKFTARKYRITSSSNYEGFHNYFSILLGFGININLVSWGKINK